LQAVMDLLPIDSGLFSWGVSAPQACKDRGAGTAARDCEVVSRALIVLGCLRERRTRSLSWSPTPRWQSRRRATACIGEGTTQQELDLSVGAAQLIGCPASQRVMDGRVQP
jgi:hypothetical protein